MIMKNLILSTLVITALSYSTLSQDFHLSQYENAPVYLNPASTGMEIPMGMDFRANINYRTQWGSITSRSYSSALLSYDSRFKNTWGIGGYIVNNTVASNKFKTLNIMLSGAYNVMHESQEHLLNVGLQFGLMNKGFNSSSYVYDSQYDNGTGTFNTTIGSGENLGGNENIFRLDGALGFYYAYTARSSKFKPYAGFSIWHITMPNESFTGNKERLPMRYSIYGGSDIHIDEQWKVRPMMLFGYQAKATDLNMGALGTYNFTDENYSAMFGLNYRLKDALIIQAGMRYQSFFFTMSYDVNLSWLSTYTNNRGGFEMSLIYLGKHKGEVAKKFFN